MSELHADLKGKVALITGASSGIGKATAILFAKLGVNLSVSGRNEKNLTSVVKDCTVFGPTILPVLCDVSNENEVKMLMEKTISHFGKLDILVNSAGILKTGSIEATSLEQYDEMFNVNVRSIYHLTMLAVPHLTKTKGTIINVSSVTGMRSFPGLLSYCMTKSAVDMFTRCVALDLAPKQIRVNSVNPGVIITEVHKRGGMSDDEYEKFLEHSKETHALGRPGKPDEVANTIAFLASNASSFITGAQLPIDGGRHIMCPTTHPDD